MEPRPADRRGDDEWVRQTFGADEVVVDAITEILHGSWEACIDYTNHLPWDHELADGTTVVQRLYDNCFAGVERVKRFRSRWETLDGAVDDRRHRHVAERFDEHVASAERWRDTLTARFRELSGIPDEEGRVPDPGA